MPRRRSPLPTVLVALVFVATSAAAQEQDRAALLATIDSIVMQPITEGRIAGMSIAVVRGNDTLVLRGYGSADLELDVPTPDRAVYEIGSVTKQFTAAAILQLRDRGLLSLDDELTEYFPDYPTEGHTITLRRLLDHTSGIKGYTEIPEFRTFARRELPRDSLVALFSSKPFDFAPGEAMIYNNSAYFLLGLIVAKVSGQSYEDYVVEHVFAPTGMDDSRYCSERELIPGKVKGYASTRGELTRAPFLVHLWPYSAGSLCSTVGDLVAWTRALHGGEFLSEESYRDMTTPGTLNDGTPLRYAMGLAVPTVNGRRAISHGGGIFGFVSQLSYYPDDDLIVAVLINSTGGVGAGAIAGGIVNAVLGPTEEPETRAFTGDAAALEGTYSGAGRGRRLSLTVHAEDDGISITGMGREAITPTWVEGLAFARGGMHLTFVERDGEVVELRVDQVSGYYVLQRED